MLSTFSAKFSYGRSKAVPPPAVVSPAYGTSGADPAVLAADGYTYNQNASMDDSFYSVNIGFTFYIYGSGSSTLCVGSNTYITLGSGSSMYGGLSLGPAAAPNIPALHLGSADNSYQRGWSKIYSDRVIIRYEGNGITSGTPGSPGIVYEATFYKSNGSNQYIQVNIGNHNKTSGVFGLTSGASSGASYLNFGTVSPNLSFYVVTDATGNNPVYHPGVYTP